MNCGISAKYSFFCFCRFYKFLFLLFKIIRVLVVYSFHMMLSCLSNSGDELSAFGLWIERVVGGIDKVLESRIFMWRKFPGSCHPNLSFGSKGIPSHSFFWFHDDAATGTRAWPKP